MKETENSILVQWTAYLQFLNVLSDYKKTYNFNVNYTEESKKFVTDLIKSGDPLEEDSKYKIKNAEIKDLSKLGFKLDLKDYQIENISNLLKKRHGANFFCTGIRKTAVTIAIHLLLRQNENFKANSLLVVSPKNAFLAWEEGLEDSFTEDCQLRKEGITELKGSYDQIKENYFFHKIEILLLIMKN